MKNLLMIILLLLALMALGAVGMVAGAVRLTAPDATEQEHEKIVENVEVSWWQVPVLAVDANGIAVADLTAAHIKLLVNGKDVTGFFFLNVRFQAKRWVKQ